MKTGLVFKAIVTLTLVMFTVQAQAAPVSVDGSDVVGSDGLLFTAINPVVAPNGNPAADYLEWMLAGHPGEYADWNPLEPSLWELYKDEQSAADLGAFAESYTTAYKDYSDPLTYSEFSITYDSPQDAITGQAYLLVKDGDADPRWYFYDLTALGWLGTEDIIGTNFWPLRGSISHVSIYGTTNPVPEPATMLLFGTGLVGLVGSRLRKKKK